MLDESDFTDTLDSPMENNEEFQIYIYISNYQNKKTVLAVLQDATAKDEEGNKTFRIRLSKTKKYFFG